MSRKLQFGRNTHVSKTIPLNLVLKETPKDVEVDITSASCPTSEGYVGQPDREEGQKFKSVTT